MTRSGATCRASLALAVAIVSLGILGGLRTAQPEAAVNAAGRGIAVAVAVSNIDLGHATAAMPQPTGSMTASLAIALGALVTTLFLVAWPGNVAVRGPSAVPATVGARWRRRGPPR
jgi:hypothetical protein